MNRTRTLFYIFKQGFINVLRNKVMLLASLMIMVATMFIFGTFFVISKNIESQMNVVKDQPEIAVVLDSALDVNQVNTVENKLKVDNRIESYVKITKEQAFEEFKKVFSDYKYIFDGKSADFLPISFNIKLKNSNDSLQFSKEYKEVQGVWQVDYSKDEINLINLISKVVNIASSIILIILTFFSILIISNTVKLTVFARRRELQIMKHIGATESYIRGPFLIEGLILGIIGALIAFLLLGFIYNTVDSSVTKQVLDSGLRNFPLVHFKDMMGSMIWTFLFAGCTLGGLGGFISVNKHIKG